MDVCIRYISDGRINHAIRSFVEDSPSCGIGGGRSLPLSVWPTLLDDLLMKAAVIR